MSEFEGQPDNAPVDLSHYEATEWDHSIMYNSAYISTPGFEGTWEQPYVDEIGGYLIRNGARMDNGTADLLNSALMGSGDFTQEGDATRYLETFHLAEAAVRDVHPWEFNTVLQAQSELNRAGIPTDSVVEQRSMLFDRLGLNQMQSMSERGSRVAGLQLVAVPFVVVDGISHGKALGMLEAVTEEYGNKYFDSKAIFQSGYQTRNQDLQNEAASRSLSIAREASIYAHDYLRENITQKEWNEYILTRNRLALVKVLKDYRDSLVEKKDDIKMRVSDMKDTLAAVLDKIRKR